MIEFFIILAFVVFIGSLIYEGRKDTTMIKRNGDTTYLCLFGRRLIWKDGTYIGWYKP